MKEILATIDVNTGKGQWHTIEVRFRISLDTLVRVMKEHAIAKAKEELGPAARGFMYSLQRWKVVE